MEKKDVSLGRRLRALAKDRGKTSPTAAQELERLAQEVDALEELAAAGAWYGTVETRSTFQAKVAMTAAVERLERVRSQQ